jgi:predicted nucleic acid-binding protein
MPLAVVDTNILVSALLRQDSPRATVVQAIWQGRLVPVVCAEIVWEYERVLTRGRFGFQQSDVQELLALVGQQAHRMSIAPYPPKLALPDPTDWPFAAAASATGCPVITGNARHFPRRMGVEVVTAREWMEKGL